MSQLRLRIYDGTRQLFAARADFFISIIDGDQVRRVEKDFFTNDLTFDLPTFEGTFQDHYSINVSTKGFRQAGFVPVILSEAHSNDLDVMLIPKNPGFSFVGARFPVASAAFPFLLPKGDNPAEAEKLYDDLLDKEEPSLACLLNLCEAMKQIPLARGGPLDYFKKIRWDKPPAADRFFAYCDRELVHQVRIGADAGVFEIEFGAGLFHPGATNSWKQKQFGEANVQLTFHENQDDCAIIHGVDCVTVEPDMDYFRDLLSHTILEVIPNGLTHTITDPADVYVLRWIAGRTARVPEFAPLYTIR